ncbi:hypothetical protein H5T55_00025 [Candidatus Bipolaricaulota bacterium]|nr:hypothetical protein [Candidatus Bipolaricaulota bacterium]
MLERMVVLGLILWVGTALAETPTYLYGEIATPPGAVDGLAARAEDLGIPTATFEADGLVVRGAEDEGELLGGRVYLYLDGAQFLVGMEVGIERAILRGDRDRAELVVWTGGDVVVPPREEFLALLRELGLLETGCSITLAVRELPLKLPRVPEGMNLDPTLWALIGHPDWFGAARDYGLERVGLRVRVVAEASGALAEDLEPYVLSSSAGLMDLLIPIGLLPVLAADPAVRTVRPPYVPHPAGG